MEKLLTPENILKNYDKYDIGEKPYEIKRNKEGEIQVVQADVLNSYKNNTQKEPKSEVRAEVLRLKKEGNKEALDELVSSFVHYLLFEKENRIEKSYHQMVRVMFQDNLLRFTQFTLDLPIENHYELFRQLANSEAVDKQERDFCEMINLELMKNKPFTDLFFERSELYTEPRQ